jgi:predicted GTPase
MILGVPGITLETSDFGVNFLNFVSPHSIIIGSSQVGKSSLGNAVLNTQAFKVGNGIASETIKPQSASGVVDGQAIRVLDFPGLHDSNGRDLQHWQALSATLGRIRTVHATAIVLNFNEILDMLKKIFLWQLGTLLERIDIWHNLCIVFTKLSSDDYADDEMMRRQQQF